MLPIEIASPLGISTWALVKNESIAQLYEYAPKLFFSVKRPHISGIFSRWLKELSGTVIYLPATTFLMPWARRRRIQVGLRRPYAGYPLHMRF